MRGAIAALALMLMPVVGLAQPTHRFSGRVERVELIEGLVVVGELGARGRPQRHEVQVGPETPIVSVRRLRSWEMRGLSAYGEEPVSLIDLLLGDFVTVESVQTGGREVARRITVVERPEPRRVP